MRQHETWGKGMGRRMRPLVGAILLVCCLAPNPRSCGAQEWTPAERAYLEQPREVTFCGDPDWVPFEWIDEEGRYRGIAADLLDLVARRTGLKLRLVPTASWEESLRMSQEGRCRMLPFLNSTPQRREWLLFTDPLFRDSSVFITRQEHPPILDPADLEGKTLALPAGTSMEERIRDRYPGIRILRAPSEREALMLVEEGGADATLRSLIVAAHTIRKEGLFNLKIAGRLPDYENQLRIGVLLGDPMLRDVLNKGIRTITPREREEIVNRYVSIEAQMGVDYRLVGRILLVLGLVLGVSAFWIVKLRRLNRKLEILSETDPLTELPNRLRLNRQCDEAWGRWEREGRPLALVLLDLDHFKRVNDTLGHLAGDQVLRDTAAEVRRHLRETDLLGRWGGEEFLLVCPGLSGEEARRVAQRICEAMRQRRFLSGHRQTLSAGVSAVRRGDTLDALLMRVDEALYRAKREGRDRVCLLD